MRFFGRLVATQIALFCFACLPSIMQGASVLTHESIIDAAWDVRLKPVLLAHYPNATPEELKAAHAYAYGGSIIQDLGYYPHGSEQFSNMTHYVRTGAFIQALIQDAKSLNELAFALGALSHYVSDADIHRNATNVGEGILYPRVERKFGPVVTYEEDPAAHLKTEFGFDVLEVARGNFAPQAYHDFIGFDMAPGVLQRAFEETYSVPLADLFPNFDKSIGSYRRDISRVIPEATRIAWAQRQSQIEKSQPGMTAQRFIYVMSRSSYERNWGKQYDRPTAMDRFLAILLKLIPPIGPLRSLKFKMPTAKVETLFMASFNRSVHQFSDDLNALQQKTLKLADINYDVGVQTPPGKYHLEDDTYAIWVHKLAERNFAGVTAEVRNAIVSYYHDPNAPLHTRDRPAEWNRLQAELKALQTTNLAVAR